MDEGRFPSGSVVAQRYRIVSLLGRGGMGEVYRANDLLVGQQVALKFLPEAWARDEAVIARFRNEARTARMVTHPNVCRVHDLGEADGRIFLSMEFIDGEDLRGLLRRIGRLPEDKGLEIARKLCAGLHAAHEKNVLHRDLKPANVMIDGRGEVLVTDFGLAGVEGSIHDLRSGTPDYMAPEQRAGLEVSVRSDIYSLGMVLHELFTGKRPDASRTSATALDPAIRSVVDRCLSEDPVDRPASAAAVARALPGGDPLAAALAAGATPSPEAVAAGGEKEGLKPAHAVPLLLLAVLGPILVAWSFDRAVPEFPVSPDELRVRARDFAKRVNGALPRHETSGAETAWVPDGARAGKALRSPHRFWYRASPVPFGSLRVSAQPALRQRDPAMDVEGMVLVALDLVSGTLIHYERVPAPGEPLPSAPVDWNEYLRLAGIDPERARKNSDTVDMVTWSYADDAGLEYEVAAVTDSGRPRLFRVRGKWEADRTGSNWPWIIEAVLTALAVLLAWWNYRAARADLQGAAALMKICGVFITAAAFLRGGDLLHWQSTLTLVDALGPPVLLSLILGAGYLAMEPYVRRLWPRFLVTWVRLLRGNWRDATVGRDVLIGLSVAATYLVLLTGAASSSGADATLLAGSLDRLPAQYLQSSAFFLAWLSGTVTVSIMRAVTSSFLLILLRRVLRNAWLAGGAWMLCFIALLIGETKTASALGVAMIATLALAQVLILVRFGFLAKVASEVMVLTTATLRTLDPSRWYSIYSFVAIACLASLAIVAYWVATGGGRPRTSGDSY